MRAQRRRPSHCPCVSRPSHPLVPGAILSESLSRSVVQVTLSSKYVFRPSRPSLITSLLRLCDYLVPVANSPESLIRPSQPRFLFAISSESPSRPCIREFSPQECDSDVSMVRDNHPDEMVTRTRHRPECRLTSESPSRSGDFSSPARTNRGSETRRKGARERGIEGAREHARARARAHTHIQTYSHKRLQAGARERKHAAGGGGS